MMLFLVLSTSLLVSNDDYAEIRIVDAETKRGVPLVELETVNGVKFVTDNAGRIAFNEPGLLNRELFFTVRSHGYEVPKDAFGFHGVRVTPNVGKPIEIKVQRSNIAERQCRLTGEGCAIITIRCCINSTLIQQSSTRAATVTVLSRFFLDFLPSPLGERGRG